MIITRSPLRISLGGGGTDLPSYYKNHGGFLIAAAIDKYIYITVTKPFFNGIYLKYSELETISSVAEIKHPIIREALSLKPLFASQIELTALADIPSGTGLGSSGSFTTALLKALHAHNRLHIQPRELAELACHIEIDRLKESIGKQDQYIAAYGGLTCFTFNSDGSVDVEPMKICLDTIHDLEDNLMLFFTGISRSASGILKDQDSRSISSDKEMLDNLHYVKDLGYRSKSALESGNTFKFGQLMHEHWEHKKNRSPGMSNSEINNWYSVAMDSGAIGGKLVGAGGGGFLMFYASDRDQLRKAMVGLGLEEVRFRFDFDGTKVLFS